LGARRREVERREPGVGQARDMRTKGGLVENSEKRVGIEQILVGVVGAGGMGGMHARNLQSRVAGARLAAVADLDTDRAGKIAKGSGSAVFRDAVELIRDAGVEAVVIASPNATHAELTLECLRVGKPVLCEKPLATTAEDALKVVEAEVELGRKLIQLGFMRRFDNQHVAVKEAVASGAIGAPLLFRGWHRNPQVVPSLVTSESIVLDSMIHDLDSVRWLFGREIDEVYTRGISTKPALEGTHDLQLTQMSVGGEFLASVEVYVAAEYGYEVGLEVVCESGTAHVAPFDEAVVRRDAAQYQRIDTNPFDRFQPAFMTEMQQWTGALRSGEHPEGPDAWDGYAALVVAESCIASLGSGSPQSVTVPERPTLYRNEGLGVVR
jgi:myo-inositol 2-dehydrogenase / D-chiro-inositol 1-dehydrogenase